MESPLGDEAGQPIPTPTTPRFFTLPLEIRLHIYSFCIPRRCAIKVTNDRYRPWGVEPIVSTRDHLIKDKFANTKPLWTNVLHVCKAMSEECLDILYGDNLFEVYLNKGTEPTLKKTFSRRNLQRIRYILAVSPGRWHTGALNPPDASFWATITPNLTFFEWVTQLDSKGRETKWDNLHLRQLEDWLVWTNSYLDCFSGCIEPNTKVKFGLNQETEAYRKVGRISFRRGPFIKSSKQK